MSTRYRKYDSGSEKRKKKQRLEAVAQSQKGALDRFIVRESPDANIDESPNVENSSHHHGDDAVEVETPVPIPEITEANNDNTTDTGHHGDDAVEVDTPVLVPEIAEADNDNTADRGSDSNVADDIENSF